MSRGKVEEDKLIEWFNNGVDLAEIAVKFGCHIRTIHIHLAKLRAENKLNLSEDEEVSRELEKVRKKAQKLQDTNRIERKTWRSKTQYENAIEEYTNALVTILEKYQIKSTVKAKKRKKHVDKTGVIHLSDHHWNELIDMPCNKFDFFIGAKRLHKLADKAKQYFKSQGIENVIIACTGDLLNSDRRLDELLNMATNRAKATILVIQLLELFILDLAEDFHITLSGVVGNESRAKKDFEWSELTATDNYDFTIYHTLKLLFRKVPNIEFDSGNSVEHVMEISGQNVLLIHGNQLKNTANLGFEYQKMRSKYISNYGIAIDFILSGHIHEAYISDTFARSSSLCGGNEFSDKALKLESRASQNLHTFYSDGSRDSLKVDLQNVEGYSGYDFEYIADAYNPKSLVKAGKKVMISRF